MSPGLTEFTLAMLAANLAFVPGSWLRGLVADPDRPALRVLFDGACPRCRSSMALVTAADPGGVRRAGRPDRGRRADDPSRLDARGLPAGDARGLGLRPGRGRVRRRAVDRGPAAAVLAVRRGRVTSRGSHRSGGSCTIALRPLGRATSLAPTRPAGSTPGRREPCLASSEATFRTHTTRVASPADSQEVPHP